MESNELIYVPPQHILPIDPTKNEIKIMQGWDGPWSHKDQYPRSNCSLLYAVDFEVPYGTLVRAARAGIIRLLLESDEYIEDPAPDPLRVSRCAVNWAKVTADDGTCDCYLHLMQHSGLVHDQDRVTVGQPICHTGKSGWVGDIPHLHFHVQSSDRGLVTIPFGFQDYPHSLWHKDRDNL